MKYRLAHRAAMFLEEIPEKQKEVFKFMQKAYDVRSAIVHGTTPKLPKNKDGRTLSLKEFCAEIENILRISMKKALSLTANQENSTHDIEWDSFIFPEKKQ